ncbi:LysE family translocator [Neobacillus rhizosphaerae]|uniref:LysE family translocator n=1 Tax=Neobacillus rhizosphaerae TaxID=2880965 RepID=UPI003D2D9C26
MNSLYLAFIATSLLLILSPGIDTALVTRNTLTYSSKGGFFTAVGIASGVLVHTLATGLGLSIIIMQSTKLYFFIKLICSFYLIYLGITTLIKRSSKAKSIVLVDGDGQKRGLLPLFGQGILTNVLNPKVAMFFLTFLPQFVQETGHFFQHALLLGCTYSALTLLWFIVYIHVMNRLKEWMTRPRVLLVMEGITGLVLLGLGINLAFATP